jgi:hypothetical protein
MTSKEYSFEFVKNYPTERRFIITKPMTKSIFDSIGRMLGTRK